MMLRELQPLTHSHYVIRSNAYIFENVKYEKKTCIETSTIMRVVCALEEK